MKAIMMYDNRDSTGLCVVEEVIETLSGEQVESNKFWVMFVEDDLWYPHGGFPSYNKAKKRLEQITNGEIECW